jgi:hypothetical protein
MNAPDVRATLLATPPLPCLAPPGVFDAFGWCESDTLLWRAPASRWDDAAPLDGSDPARMVFVMLEPLAPLPRELARLHAPGLGLTTEWALAPYAIDDATDTLHELRLRPREALWLAADNLNALFWGLHDWAHFHNHGPFEQRAWTELQCDASALAWLWRNRSEIGLAADRWERLRLDVLALGNTRFADEGLALDPALLAAASLMGLGPPGAGARRARRISLRDGAASARGPD